MVNYFKPPLNPQHVAMSLDLVSQYVKRGVPKFADIVKDFYFSEGHEAINYFEFLKAGYGAYYQIAPDTEAQKMDPIVRHIEFDDIVKLAREEQLLDPVYTPGVDFPWTEPTPQDIAATAKNWIQHIKDHNKPYYRQLKEEGRLQSRALEKSERYWSYLLQLEMSGLYPPSGAGEVARQELYWEP